TRGRPDDGSPRPAPPRPAPTPPGPRRPSRAEPADTARHRTSTISRGRRDGGTSGGITGVGHRGMRPLIRYPITAPGGRAQLLRGDLLPNERQGGGKRRSFPSFPMATILKLCLEYQWLRFVNSHRVLPRVR